jgi:hypothetical protein
MPKQKDTITKKTPEDQPPHKPKTAVATYESTSYLQGLFAEFKEQTQKYNDLTGQLLRLEARIELTEKTLCLTRDHFKMTIARTQDAVPNDWDKVLNSVRFVGVRLADACAQSLQAHKKMTPEQLLRDLNDGMFRFRTNSPHREIHAALLRHPYVKRTAAAYVWVAPPEETQLPMRLRVVRRDLTQPSVAKEEKAEVKPN